ncbi:MAG TPA: enoyl-CoA hydratase/isomerase family protein, partial [Saprospiraceae bacterium]|nr:enoyl-CoA hydratase/isomerase family protein [Saprospiraceae bacterium]
MKSNTIKIENRGAVAILSLNRPEVFHSFNREMSYALLEALSTAEEDNNIRAIIITGSGKA